MKSTTLLGFVMVLSLFLCIGSAAAETGITDKCAEITKSTESGIEPAKEAPAAPKTESEIDVPFWYNAPPAPPAVHTGRSALARLVETGGEDYLSDKAKEALALLPDWLKDDFTENLSRLSAEKQDEWAQVILDLDDPNLRDEVGFCIARIGAGTLKNKANLKRLIVENAQMIYERAERLDYVQLTEHGDAESGGDYYTTALYCVKDGPDGAIVEREVEYLYYYWFVVHPKLSDESLNYLNPATGKSADPDVNGRFWRGYLMEEESNRDLSYSDHYILKTPDFLEVEDLNGWGPSASGEIAPGTNAPTEIIRAESGELLLAEISYAGDTTCQGDPPGTGGGQGGQGGLILITTLWLEKAYRNGKCELLQRLVSYWNVDSTLPTDAKILILSENDSAADTCFDALLDGGYKADKIDILDSSVIGALDLSEYRKVVVPSDQPISFYDMLGQNTQWMAEYVGCSSEDNVFEIHAAAEADWSGTRIINGITVQNLDSKDFDAVELYGHPKLADVLEGTEAFWDRGHYTLDGERYFGQDDFALDRIANFVTKNLKRRLVEWGEVHPGQNLTRSIQPVRIIYQHTGNCGEIQDLLGAAGRSGLAPTLCAGDHAADHVWNMFRFDGDWRPYEIRWSASDTLIDAEPKGRLDTEFGGWVQTRCIMGYRSDGLNLNVTPYYSSYCNLTVDVKDGAGKPIDGANVVFLADSVYGGYHAVCFKAYTDCNGRAVAQLGEVQPEYECRYYIRVSAGDYMYPTTGDDAMVIEHADADVDYAGEVSFHWINNAVPQVTELPVTFDPEKYRVRVRSKVAYEVVNFGGDSAFMNSETGFMDDFFLDDANCDLFAEGSDCEGYLPRIQTDGDEEVVFNILHEGPWHYVISNKRRYNNKVIVDVDFTLEKNEAESWNAIERITKRARIPAGDYYAVTIDGLEGPFPATPTYIPATPTPAPTPTQTPTGPAATISTDRESYEAGDLMSVFIGVENAGAAREVDAYIAVNALDQFFFFPAFSPCPMPMNVLLAENFQIADVEIFSVTVGDWGVAEMTWFFALAEPHTTDILDLDRQRVTFPL